MSRLAPLEPAGPPQTASASGAPADERAAPRGRGAVRKSATLSALIVGVYVFIAGTTPVAARDAIDELPVFSTGLVRFGIAAVLLWLTLLIRPGRGGIAGLLPERRDLGHILLCGLFCVPINQISFLGGVKLASAAHAGLLYGLTPVMVYVITLLLGRAALSRRMALASLLAFCGAAAVAWDGLRATKSPTFFRGDLLLLGAVLTWAVYSLLITPLANKYGPVRATAMVMLTGAVLYLPALLVDGDKLHVRDLSPRALGGFLYITIATAYFNYLLWSIALLRVDINRLTVSASASPLVAVVASHYWHHDALTSWLMLGAALILTAITLANWDRIRALSGKKTKIANYE